VSTRPLPVPLPALDRQPHQGAAAPDQLARVRVAGNRMGEGVAGKFRSRCPPCGVVLCPTFPTFHLSGIRYGRGVIAERCPRFLSPVSGQAGGSEVGTLPGSSSASCSPPGGTRLLKTPDPSTHRGTQDLPGGTRFPPTPGFSGLLNPFPAFLRQPSTPAGRGPLGRRGLCPAAKPRRDARPHRHCSGFQR